MVARPKDPKLDRLFSELPAELGPTARRLRQVVRSTSPELTECVKWGNPVWFGRGDTLCIMVYPHHLNLGFFRGAELSRTFPAITGTGKSLRHVRISSPREAESRAVRSMIRAAAQLDARSA
ncbi:MAG: DUF1801 domain-containing protein [Thermoplasmata archaeon]|nr:DUF1801 domain-containing protein [Thermoplasmata archaeon]MCI4359311.1 DUF1801 domain-containing protein [Thermoplasmata archaeon]